MYSSKMAEPIEMSFGGRRGAEVGGPMEPWVRWELASPTGRAILGSEPAH